jgi:murein DD-endopeptidase MepM/ murein hydrolase activator NlpD
MRKPFPRIVAGLLVTALTLPVGAAVSEGEIEEARREVDRILAEAQELGDEVQRAWARQSELDREIAGLEQSIGHARAQLDETEARIESVAVEMYMASASGASLSVLISNGNDRAQAGLEYLGEVSGSDRDLVDQLRSLRSELDRQTSRLEVASAEQADLTAELEGMAEDLQTQLATAQVFYDRLVEQRRVEEEARRQAEEEARRQAEAAATTSTAPTVNPTTTVSGGGTPSTTTPPAAPPPPAGGDPLCPVAGPVSFSNTWGAPRSGGRAHQGVDMIAARGTPAVAILGGRIHRITSGSLGGLSVWLRSADGDQFYYAHLDGYGDIAVGQTVEQGHVLGFVGSTGNAPEWLPHLHFEYHPGGGGAVNPYPLVRQAC